MIVKTFFVQPTQDEWDKLPNGPIILKREPVPGSMSVVVKKTGNKDPKKGDDAPKDTETDAAAATGAEEKKEKKGPNYKEMSSHLLN